MKIAFSFLLSFFFIACAAPAQKVLQMEKFGKVKTTKFYIGDEITFTLQDDSKYWYKGVIQDILVEEGLVLMRNQAVKVNEISAIRSFHPSRWSRPISSNLFVFAASWTLFKIATLPFNSGSVFDTKIGVADGVIVGSAVVLGFLIRKIFKYRTYKIGKKRRLRLLDLNFFGP